MKSITLALFFYFSIMLCADILEVDINGSTPYTVIQEAINSSTIGDTVLVYPGTYYENLNLSGRSLHLISLQAITGNEAYIDSTIIDGNDLDSCILINDGSEIRIQGFTLRKGLGNFFYPYSNYNNGGGICARNCNQVEIKHCKIFSNNANLGAGLYVNNSSQFDISSCNVNGNNADHGGGVYTRFTTGNMENVNISSNIAKYNAGGLYMYAYAMDFSQENRCSIYKNRSTSFQDILVHRSESDIDICLDRISFDNPSQFYIGYQKYLYENHVINLVYNTAVNEYIDHDIFISPSGDDNNSGLTPSAALSSINNAAYYIKADSLNPKTIYLLPGDYTSQNQSNNVILKGYITLKGESEQNTILKSYGDLYIKLNIAAHSKNVKIKDITFEDCNTYAITSYISCGDIKISNVTIDNSDEFSGAGICIYSAEEVILTDILIKDCSYHRASSIKIYNCKNVFIDNLISLNNEVSGYENMEAVNWIQFSNRLEITNSRFIGNKNLEHSDIFSDSAISTLEIRSSTSNDIPEYWLVQNCLFFGNEAMRNAIGEGGDIAKIGPYCQKGYFLNNTMINNRAEYTLKIGSLDSYLINNILYNDSFKEFIPRSVYYEGEFYSNVTIGNNIVHNGNAGFWDTNDNDTVWLDQPINMDPQLITNYVNWPYYPDINSPAIDAGAAELPDALFYPENDLSGHSRICGEQVDIGCYEKNEEFIELELTSNPDILVAMPNIFNYPNPFNPTTNISFNTELYEQDEQIQIEIYNIRGQRIRDFKMENVTRKMNEVTWNGTDQQNNPVSSGVYFATLKAGNKVLASRKMLLLK